MARKQPKTPPKTRAVVAKKVDSRFYELPDSGLNRIKAQVAFAIAEGVEKDSEITKRMSLAPTAISRWRGEEVFVKVVELYRERIKEQIEHIATRDKVERMRRLDKLAGRMEGVIDDRADKYKKSAQPGAKRGIMEKVRGGFRFDASLIREYRGTLEQQAKEGGGAFERPENAPAGGGNTTVIVLPMVQAGGAPRPRILDASVELDVSRR